MGEKERRLRGRKVKDEERKEGDPLASKRQHYTKLEKLEGKVPLVVIQGLMNHR